MNDQEKFIALYKDFGITLEVINNDQGSFIKLDEDVDEKFSGYTFFYSMVHFDEDGRFMGQSFAE